MQRDNVVGCILQTSCQDECLICEIDDSGFVKHETHLLFYFSILRDSAGEMTVSRVLTVYMNKSTKLGNLQTHLN